MSESTKAKVAVSPDLDEALNRIGKKDKQRDAPWVYVAVPNQGEINMHLFQRLWQMAEERRYRLIFNTAGGLRFHDFARNKIAYDFLKHPDKPEWLMMIDDDVCPHRNVLNLIAANKDINSGLVFCWMNGRLLPSLWVRAECEQCRVRNVWLNEKKVHDHEIYREHDGALIRWDPEHQWWVPFIDADGKQHECRCKGTGVDPWMFKAIDIAVGDTLKRADSAGAACFVVRRNVIEGMEPPWFCFLYKPSRKIMLTEDHYFFWKAQEAGFEVWCSPQTPRSHFKTVDLLQVFALLGKSYAKGHADARGVEYSEDRVIEIPDPKQIEAFA